MFCGAINGTDLINQPWDTIVSPFIALLGNGFYLVPLSFLSVALYVKTRDFALTSAFILGSGILLSGGSMFTNYPEMAGVYGVFAAIGITGIVLSVFYKIRRH